MSMGNYCASDRGAAAAEDGADKQPRVDLAKPQVALMDGQDRRPSAGLTDASIAAALPGRDANRHTVSAKFTQVSYCLVL